MVGVVAAPLLVEACAEVVRAALSLGGTISGEHGVGTRKRDFLPWELGDVAMDLHRRIKQALDPAGVLNPGKVLAAR